MECVGTLESGDVEVTGLPRVVWEVESDAPVETDDEKTEVVAQADTRTHGEVVEEFRGLELHQFHDFPIIFISLFWR